MTLEPNPPPGSGPITRRSLLAGSVGVASTLTVGGVLSEIAPGASTPAVPPAPLPTVTPTDPVIAYVQDPERGEVTLISGLREITYHDPELAARLIAAAPTSTPVVG
jgi:hypothetical protein